MEYFLTPDLIIIRLCDNHATHIYLFTSLKTTQARSWRAGLYPFKSLFCTWTICYIARTAVVSNTLLGGRLAGACHIDRESNVSRHVTSRVLLGNACSISLLIEGLTAIRTDLFQVDPTIRDPAAHCKELIHFTMLHDRR